MKLYLIPMILFPTIGLAQEGPAHWTYMGAEGADHWSELSGDFATCGSGKAQSPIDLTETATKGNLDYSLDYGSLPLSIWNNGHTIQVDAKGVGVLSENGKNYVLQQVHFHDPSEHTLGERHFPLEVHFVHRSPSGDLAVLGAFIEEGAENPELAKVIANMPKEPGDPVTIKDETFSPEGLLPENHAVYAYSGSLTTPPCSEGVSWHVLSHPITASADQIAALSAQMGENNRPLQASNGRAVIAPAE